MVGNLIRCGQNWNSNYEDSADRLLAFAGVCLVLLTDNAENRRIDCKSCGLAEHPMQYRLSTLLILMALIGVYFAILNMPTFIAVFLFFAVVLVTPAYWVTGVVYAREQRRAYFIGGMAAGTIPFLLLGYFGMMMFFRGPGPWNFNRYQLGETQMVNMLMSLFVFSPALLAFAGGWIGQSVYHSLHTAANSDNAAVYAQHAAKRPHPLDRDVEPVNS